VKWGGLPTSDTPMLFASLGGSASFFDRQAKGSHEIWWDQTTRARTTIPNHPGDIPEGTLRARSFERPEAIKISF